MPAVSAGTPKHGSSNPTEPRIVTPQSVTSKSDHVRDVARRLEQRDVRRQLADVLADRDELVELAA